MDSFVRRHAFLIFVLALYLPAGFLFATKTPAWQAPDEPAHYNYIRQLADGEFPVIEEGDYDQAYLEDILENRFGPGYSIESLEYEDYQPPAYYLLQTPVYEISNGSLTALRLLSLLMGVGIVILAHATFRLLFPQTGWLAWIATAFVALLPQHLAILTSVNNDALAWLLVAASLYLLVRLEQQESLSRRDLALFGLLLGLCLLTKVTAYLMLPVAGLWLLGRFWRQWRDLLAHAVTLFLPALLLGLVWWVRNLVVYGGLDILGTAAHNAVVTGQLQTDTLVSQFGLAETIRRLLLTTFHSFWGQFGWMGVPMPGWVYSLLALFSLALLVGLLWRWSRTWRISSLHRPLVVLFILNVGLFLAYNLTFVQHQGRYLFSSLIPIGAGVALGAGVWVRPIIARIPAAAFLLPAGLALGLFLLNMMALTYWIVPDLTP